MADDALSAILQHLASGGSINVKGPSGGVKPDDSAPAPSAPPANAAPAPALGPGPGGPAAMPLPPPPPPPPMNFTDFATRPENGMAIQGALSTKPNQPTPFNHPPAPPALSAFNPSPNIFNPSPMPSMPPVSSPDVAPAMPASAGAPTPAAPALPSVSTPNVAPGLMTQDEYFAAHPEMAAHPQASTPLGKALLFLTAGLSGAAGGLHGDPLAGVRYAQGVGDYNRSVPDVNQQRYESGAVKPFQQAIQNADIQSQTAERIAQGKKADALANADTMTPITKEEAVAFGHPEFEGMMANARNRQALATTAQATAGKVAVGAGHDAASTANAAGKNATTLTVAGQKVQASKEIADAHNKTAVLMQGMRSATSRANNENTVAHKGTAAGGGSFKVPADVTKRAALASNVNENADAVEQIISKRPDIVGSAGGRFSSIQQMIGSNDPDIQALGVRMHNIALASNGAHGLRSAEAVAKTENDLFNNFKTGTQGIKGGLDATRSSVQTFLDDEKNFSTTGKRTGSAPQDDMIGVQIPGQQPGKIHASQLAAFKAKYPNATQVQ